MTCFFFSKATIFDGGSLHFWILEESSTGFRRNDKPYFWHCIVLF